MSSEHKTLLTVLSTLAVLIPTVLGVSLGWPTPLWIFLVLLLLGIPFVVRKNIIQRMQIDALNAARESPRNPPVEPEPYCQELVTDMALPTSMRDYEFRFSATIHWHPVVGVTKLPHANPGALAVNTVLSRAREAVVSEAPAETATTQLRLNELLGSPAADDSGCIETFATDIVLALSDEDSRRLRRLAELRKDEHVWETERDRERNMRTYLAEDVLTDTGSALVWWLARNPAEIDEAVRLIGPLSRLSAAAHNNTPLPDAAQPDQQNHGGCSLVAWQGDSADSPIGNGMFHDGAFHGNPFGTAVWRDGDAADHLSGLMDRIGLDREAAERSVLANRVARMVDTAGNPEAADEIRRRLDTPGAGSAPDQAVVEHSEAQDPPAAVTGHDSPSNGKLAAQSEKLDSSGSTRQPPDY